MIWICFLLLAIAAILIFLFLKSKKAKKNPLSPITELAECEIQISICSQEIDALCQYQLQILQAVCFAEKEDKSNKTLVFSFLNPNTKKQFFFYQENKNPNKKAEELAAALQKAQNYQIHLDLEQQKIIFWQQIYNLRATQQTKHKLLVVKYEDLEQQYKNAATVSEFETWLAELKKISE